MTKQEQQPNNDPPQAADDKSRQASVEDAHAAATDAAFQQSQETDETAQEKVQQDAESDAETRIADLQSQLEEANQRALRLQAELENFRKRTQRTMEEERRYACLPLMRDLLTVVDNLQRAIDAAEQHENASGLLEGVKMVAQHLVDILKRHHCTPIEAEGVAFDPHLHEAIGQQPSTSQPPGTVLHVATRGYQLHDRVVRPSQVIVAAAAENSGAKPEENEASDEESQDQ